MINSKENDELNKELSDIVITSVSENFQNRLSKDERFNYEVFLNILNFRYIYYDSMIWTKTNYMGIETFKFPTDMWIIQELIHKLTPIAFVETGTWKGGTSLYVAHLFDALKYGSVITVENNPKDNLPIHDRIHYLVGDCLSDEIINKIKNILNNLGEGNVIVNLDSYHMENHVLKEMELYSTFVTPNSYLIVEDGILGHPVMVRDKENKLIFPGPQEAIHKFLKKHNEFRIDKEMEKFMLTSNPNGYLKRIVNAKN